MSLGSNHQKKYSGVLLHPTSLPGGSYCGTFGEATIEWLELLSINNISSWQFLPLSPTDSKGSPYSSPSSFAINPWLLDVNELIKGKFICETEETKKIKLDGEKLNFFEFKIADKLSTIVGNLLIESWESQPTEIKNHFLYWCKKNNWVRDYSLFMSLKENFKFSPWWNWPKELKLRNKEAIDQWEKTNPKSILIQKLIQWHLNRQWLKIKRIAEIKGIKLIGDLPFYVSKDSVDVWSNNSLFTISTTGDLSFQSGVPPDYFSSTGQLWGTPVYEWEKHKETNFNWWKKRFKRQFELVDILRLDHFRALESYWRIDGKAKNAMEGKWIQSPGKELLDSLKEFLELDTLPIIAEDLGIINQEVINLRKKYSLPGMKILQFAFDGNEDNPYLPQNIHGDNWVVYTGTHDNSTTVSWWDQLEPNLKENIQNEYDLSDNPSWKLIELGMKSRANLFIAPIQDILSLDDSSRTNKPGTIENNWKWKIRSTLNELKPSLEKYGNFSKRYFRY